MITNKLNSRVFQVLLNLTLTLTLLIGSAAFPTNARAASTITVNSTADNTTAADGFCTLREAITNANANIDVTGGDCVAGSGADTIIFAGSLGTATITLASTLPTITEGAGLTIDGDNRITISGNNSVQVLYVTSAASLTLQNISVTNANAASGGAGGLYSEGAVTITHSTFSNNNAPNSSGGGVANNGGTLTITNSAFSNNSTLGDGGGVANISGTLTIANSAFSNNSAGGGGGGVINNSGTATILNSTFSGNSATYDGGGVFTWKGAVSPPTTTIRNTILANSVAGYDDCWNHATGTLIGGNNIIKQTSTCNSIATITSDPNLGLLTGSPAYFPLNTGSPAINAGDDAICAAAPVNNTSQNGVARPQGAHCDIGSYEFTGGDTTGVFRPGNGLLYLKNTNTSGFADVAINYGLGGDYPVTGDWDGNGTDTIGIYRNGIFYLRNSNTLGFADLVFAFGTPGDQPIAGDWDNSGTDTIGVYRGSTVTFMLRNSNSAGAPDVSFQLGLPGDIGIAGDWNGDGVDTTGVFRPSNGVIFMKNANTSGFADIAINYGIAGDQPVTGDWDNDGIDTIGVYRNAQFLLRNSNTLGFADIVFALGIPGDMPIAGDWDGLP